MTRVEWETHFTQALKKSLNPTQGNFVVSGFEVPRAIADDSADQNTATQRAVIARAQGFADACDELLGSNATFFREDSKNMLIQKDGSINEFLKPDVARILK